MCIWPFGKRTAKGKQREDSTGTQAKPNAQPPSPRAAAARAPPTTAPESTNGDSGTHHGGGGDTAQCSSITTEGPTTSNPGQPANPVSTPGQPARQRGTQKGAPGSSYESDDEGAGPATAEDRLNDITRSVKGHANAAGAGSKDEAARRQADEVAKRLNGDRAPGPHEAKGRVLAEAEPAPTPPAAVAPRPDDPRPNGEPQPPAVPGPGAAAAVAAAAAEAGAQEGPAAGGAAEGSGGAGQQGSDEYEIDLDIDLSKGELKVDYSTRGLLGQGGFAAVYKGRYKGQRVAVKMIKKTAGSSLVDLQEDMNALMHELHILRQVNHPNIVTLFGGCLKPPHIFLVEERMEGTLDFYVHQVRRNDALSVREVVYFALDIACGLSYLHPRIVHRDLKPANVLLSREGRCKISDFGLARTKMKEYLSTKNLDAGTTAYIAPECFMSMDNPDMHDLRRSVTDRTDIYALGIIMWEMLAGKRPWQGLKPLLVAYQVAYRSLRPPLFELGSRCPSKLRQLVEECWCQEPKQRPSSQQVVDRLLEILNALPPEQEYGYAPQPAAPQPPLGAYHPQLAGVPVVVSPHDVMLL